MYCCHQIWNNLWYFPLCLEAVCHKDEPTRQRFSFSIIRINYDKVMHVLVCLFLSYCEPNGQAYCGLVLVKCHHFSGIRLPLGGPLTPWLWATEPCCPCVWSATRCSEGKNKNIQSTKIWRHIWNHWFCHTWAIRAWAVFLPTTRECVYTLYRDWSLS